MCVQAHGQVRDSERSPAPPPRGKSQPLWLSVSSSVQWETTIPNHLGQRKWSKALAPASGRATVPQSLSAHSCASPHVVGRPQLGHVVSISPSKGTAHFHIPSPVPENALPGGHLRSCVTHGATETACQARDVQPTHIPRAPASSRSAQDGVAPCPAPPSCSPPSSAHPIPPSQSRSEPCRAGGPPTGRPCTSRVLPRSDLMAMSPELPQDRNMLSLTHRGSPGPWRLTAPNPTPQDLPTHTFRGRRGPKKVSLLLALERSLQACHPTHRCHSPTRVPSPILA